VTKASGLGHNLYVAQYDLSGDAGSVDTIAGTRGSVEVTGISSLAVERILTHRDAEISFTSYWNTGTDQVHTALSGLVTTDRIATYAGLTTAAGVVGDPAASMIGKQINYDPTRGDDGSLVTSTQILANGYPLEWGQLLTTGKQTYATGTVNGTSIDLGAVSTLFGSSAYLHVFSIGSGTSTFTIKDSSDDITFGTTLHTFTAVTAATSERLQGSTSGTVRRYVRLEKTGVSTATVAVVVFVRHLTSQAI
jgi:hypothetical protein